MCMWNFRFAGPRMQDTLNSTNVSRPSGGGWDCIFAASTYKSVKLPAPTATGTLRLHYYAIRTASVYRAPFFMVHVLIVCPSWDRAISKQCTLRREITPLWFHNLRKKNLPHISARYRRLPNKIMLSSSFYNVFPPSAPTPFSLCPCPLIVNTARNYQTMHLKMRYETGKISLTSTPHQIESADCTIQKFYLRLMSSLATAARQVAPPSADTHTLWKLCFAFDISLGRATTILCSRATLTLPNKRLLPFRSH